VPLSLLLYLEGVDVRTVFVVLVAAREIKSYFKMKEWRQKYGTAMRLKAANYCLILYIMYMNVYFFIRNRD